MWPWCGRLGPFAVGLVITCWPFTGYISAHKVLPSNHVLILYCCSCCAYVWVEGEKRTNESTWRNSVILSSNACRVSMFVFNCTRLCNVWYIACCLKSRAIWSGHWRMWVKSSLCELHRGHIGVVVRCCLLRKTWVGTHLCMSLTIFAQLCIFFDRR